MNTSIIAAAALAVLALAPIATATSVQAQQTRTSTPNYPDDPGPVSTFSCTEALGHLRRVYPEEIAAVDHPTKVWVTPICINEDSVFRSDGNAGSLRAAIAANPAIQQALAEQSFGPEDVVGVRMTGPDTGNILVHPFQSTYHR